MAIRLLNTKECQMIVERLIKLGDKVNGTRYHEAGPAYTSLMICFLSHNLVSAKSLLCLYNSSGIDWFPATVGYAIVRPMFEINVTAHYISRSPVDRSQQFIEFEDVLKKRELDAYSKHRNSNNPEWHDVIKLKWQEHYSLEEMEINTKYKAVYHKFERNNKKGKVITYKNWSGKTIQQMAIEVDHEEAYDIFYSDLSSFTHADVRLANRFLHIKNDELSWSQRTAEGDVGHVFHFAATFLTCFLELFAEQFNVWSKDDVQACWNIGRMLSV